MKKMASQKRYRQLEHSDPAGPKTPSLSELIQHKVVLCADGGRDVSITLNKYQISDSSWKHELGANILKNWPRLLSLPLFMPKEHFFLHTHTHTSLSQLNQPKSKELLVIVSDLPFYAFITALGWTSQPWNLLSSCVETTNRAICNYTANNNKVK